MKKPRSNLGMQAYAVKRKNIRYLALPETHLPATKIGPKHGNPQNLNPNMTS
jgi:hypothetical protein